MRSKCSSGFASFRAREVSTIKDKGPECILRRREGREQARRGEEKALCLAQNVWCRQPTVKHSIQWRLGALGDVGVLGMHELCDLTLGVQHTEEKSVE